VKLDMVKYLSFEAVVPVKMDSSHRDPELDEPKARTLLASLGVAPRDTNRALKILRVRVEQVAAQVSYEDLI